MKVFLHGVDARAMRTMRLFLEGPCQGVAELAGNLDADVDMFDYDVIASRIRLQQHLDDGLLRPVVVLSVEDYAHEGVTHVRKPVCVDDMLDALENAKKIAAKVTHVTSGYGAGLKSAIPSMSVNPLARPLNGKPEGEASLDAENQLKQISDWFDNEL